MKSSTSDVEEYSLIVTRSRLISLQTQQQARYNFWMRSTPKLFAAAQLFDAGHKL
jgi:hypothetical protein